MTNDEARDAARAGAAGPPRRSRLAVTTIAAAVAVTGGGVSGAAGLLDGGRDGGAAGPPGASVGHAAEPGGGEDAEGAAGSGAARPAPGAAAEIPGGGMAVVSADAEGRSLTLSFWGGVCQEYVATAVETAGEVAVAVAPRAGTGAGSCVLAAARRTVRVELTRPLGDRAVVGERGQEIPVR